MAFALSTSVSGTGGSCAQMEGIRGQGGRGSNDGDSYAENAKIMRLFSKAPKLRKIWASKNHGKNERKNQVKILAPIIW